MRLRRRPVRVDDGSKAPDGPPVRGPWCDKDCYTGWDAPRHSVACQERQIEASHRVDANQREFDRQMREYLDYIDHRRP
jgi:hypothetical protein